MNIFRQDRNVIGNCYYKFLCFIHRSSREGTQIIFPSDTDDETFDNFVLRKRCKKFQCSPTPKQLKGKEKEVNR